MNYLAKLKDKIGKGQAGESTMDDPFGSFGSSDPKRFPEDKISKGQDDKIVEADPGPGPILG